jgi:hypothetical protein
MLIGAYKKKKYMQQNYVRKFLSFFENLNFAIVLKKIKGRIG